MPAPTSPIALSSTQQAYLSLFDGYLDRAFGAGATSGGSLIELGMQAYSDDTKMVTAKIQPDQMRTNVRAAFRQVLAALMASGQTPCRSFTDTSGTPGDATANTDTGRATVATSSSTITITNSNVLSSSVVLCQVEGAQGTISGVVVSSGHFTVNLAVAATSPGLTFRWVVLN